VLGGLAFVCSAVGTVKPGVWNHAFLGYNLITAVVFLLNTKQPIVDTWPTIEADPMALKVGIIYGEVRLNKQSCCGTSPRSAAVSCVGFLA
jgi:hypothetical protein